MAFDVSALPDYVDQNREELIGVAVGGASSMQILDVQTGFKSAGAINRLDTDVKFQDGAACGRTPDGTTTLDQRILTVGEIKVEEDLCVRTLNKKYTQHEVKAGSKDDVVPFEKEYTEMKSKKIANRNEIAIWQGDTTSGDQNLNRFDGLIKIIDAEGNVVAGNISAATAITVSNVLGLVDDMEASISNAVYEDPEKQTAVLVGFDIFRLWKQALKNANLYHFAPNEAQTEFMIPATNTKIIALQGLTGTDRMFAGAVGDNGGFVIGVDLENEEEEFTMYYFQYGDVVAFTARFKTGTQIKFPEEIVQFTLAV